MPLTPALWYPLLLPREKPRVPLLLHLSQRCAKLSSSKSCAKLSMGMGALANTRGLGMAVKAMADSEKNPILVDGAPSLCKLLVAALVTRATPVLPRRCERV